MSTAASGELPGYEQPPVVEIVVAVQFQPLRRFGMPEIVKLAQELGDEWRIADVPPALDRMVEELGGPTESAGMINFGFQPPPRGVFVSTDDRWVAQVQSDRLAIHERKRPTRPSFAHVEPRLMELRDSVGRAADAPLFGGAHPAELVEVIYRNQIPTSAADVPNVLRSVSELGLNRVHGAIDGFNQGFSTRLGGDGELFEGRLRVLASLEGQPSGDQALHLELISRRYVRQHALPDVLQRSHRDIVEGFTAITHEGMHERWGRFR